MKSLATTALLAILVTLAGCRTAANRPDSYESVVQRAYQEGQDAFDDGDYLGAIGKFNMIRNQFPYSQYATLAELRIGDAYYAQEQYASAIEQYRGFIKLHPNHPKVVYAHFRIAQSFYGEMPEDWFHLPPTYEKDLTKTRDARREFAYFLKKYPKSKYSDQARRKLAMIRRRLADHEFYVATFYLDRDNPRAAAMRLRYLLEHYSGLGLDPNALFLLARSYLELGDTKKARAALDDLIQYHPDTSLARRARSYLRDHPLGGPSG